MNMIVRVYIWYYRGLSIDSRHLTTYFGYHRLFLLVANGDYDNSDNKM